MAEQLNCTELEGDDYERTKEKNKTCIVSHCFLLNLVEIVTATEITMGLFNRDPWDSWCVGAQICRCPIRLHLRGKTGVY